MRTIETKKMVLAVLTATIVLTLASVSYIEPAAAHHKVLHTQDEPDSEEEAAETAEAEEAALEEAAEAEEAAREEAEEEAEDD
jgi:hypothetical protein